MDQVMLMTREEAVRLDPDRLEQLVGQLGRTQAEELVCRALEELAVRLSHLERMYRRGDGSELRKGARALAGIADQVGMCALSRVAVDVVACIDDRDEVALAAVLGRLVRVGERSLTEVWSMQRPMI